MQLTWVTCLIFSMDSNDLENTSLSRTMKSLRFYSTWKLKCFLASFMEMGRRYETLGSKTKKNSLLPRAIAVPKASMYLHQFTKPQLSQVIWKGLYDVFIYSVMCYKGASWNLKSSKQACHLLWRKTVSIFQSCYLYKHPWKDTPERKIVGAWLARYAEVWETHGEPSTNILISISLLFIQYISLNLYTLI